ncbi:non-structural protein [Calchaqui virus]|uniref:Non-structural protein NS-S n=1 Tax=Calchaqui virus TaxID=1552845 RepID=A0A097C053_9VIRU|nr:non-structural protein [Calchaqui virus]
MIRRQALALMIQRENMINLLVLTGSNLLQQTLNVFSCMHARPRLVFQRTRRNAERLLLELGRLRLLITIIDEPLQLRCRTMILPCTAFPDILPCTVCRPVWRMRSLSSESDQQSSTRSLSPWGSTGSMEQ